MFWQDTNIWFYTQYKCHFKHDSCFLEMERSSSSYYNKSMLSETFHCQTNIIGTTELLEQ